MKENSLNVGENRTENGHIVDGELNARNCPQKVEFERDLEKTNVILSPNLLAF